MNFYRNCSYHVKLEINFYCIIIINKLFQVVFKFFFYLLQQIGLTIPKNHQGIQRHVLNQNEDHLANFGKSTLVDLNFELQVGICRALLKSQQS